MKKRLFHTAICAFLWGALMASCTRNLVLEVDGGQIEGVIDEEGVMVYKGIPYAKAERFMAPVAPDNWEGIRSSRAYGPTCPQTKRMGWYSDESAFAFNWDDGFPVAGIDSSLMDILYWKKHAAPAAESRHLWI